MTTPQEGAVQTKQQDTHTPEETTQMLRQILEAIGNTATKDNIVQIRAEMATKEDVRKMIAESEHRVKDYTDKRIGEAEGKIIGIVRKEDEKIDETIRTLEVNEVVSTEESGRLQHLGPFTKLA